jgi:Leucine-rich repeat (LRR) protein
VCQWYGVDCTADTSGSPETISLLLPSNNLTGHLPDSLARLCSLNSLVLEDNDIQSVSALGQYPLPNIWVINLARNNISALPPHFGKYCAVMRVRVVGVAGPNWWMAGNLTNLHGLALGLNPLGGGFPDWMKNLTSLWILDLTECGLSGTLPDIFGGSLPFLFHLVRSRPRLPCDLCCVLLDSAIRIHRTHRTPHRTRTHRGCPTTISQAICPAIGVECRNWSTTSST